MRSKGVTGQPALVRGAGSRPIVLSSIRLSDMATALGRHLLILNPALDQLAAVHDPCACAEERYKPTLCPPLALC